MRQQFKDFKDLIEIERIKSIDKSFYENHCKGVSFGQSIKQVNLTKNAQPEEYYRARFVWSLIQSKKYDSSQICLELPIKIGSNGNKGVKVDILIFEDGWEKLSNVGDGLVQIELQNISSKFLVIIEGKKANKGINDAVLKQIIPVMNQFTVKTDQVRNICYGVYFDNEDSPIILKRINANPVRRFSDDKQRDSHTDQIYKLNLNERDDINDMPSYEELMSKTNPNSLIDMKKDTNYEIEANDIYNYINGSSI